MIEKIIRNSFLCPKCQSEIDVLLDKNFKILCNKCLSQYNIKNNIPRFVGEENYADNFGYQWNLYNQTQLDSKSNLNLSRNRFFHVTKWEKDLSGQIILEAGCGMGRFTEVAIQTNATVFSFDYSNAVDANYKNNGDSQNLHLFQANIFALPLKNNLFDKIFCLGVLQHTPDPKKAFFSLIPKLKKGGEICIDIYDFSFRTIFNLKYWFRPLTRLLNPNKLYKIIKLLVPILFPIKMFITEKIPFGKYLAFFIPIAYHKGFIPEMNNLSYDELVEWSILDTFDKYSPKYDKPKTIKTDRKWFEKAGLTNIKIAYGPNGIIAKGEK